MKIALALFVAVEVALLIAAIATHAPQRGALSMLLVLTGTTTFTVNVARRRPQPRAAWWLVVASAWTIIAQAVAVSIAHGLREEALVTALIPVLLTALPYPLLAVALGLLSRVTARRGPVDALDATMVALAGFLLLWVFAIEREFELRPGTAAVIVVLPASALLVFTMAAKVVLGGGLRDPATALLVVTVAVLLAVTVGTFLLGIPSNALRTNGVTNLLWCTHAPLLGLLSFLPSFTRPRRLVEAATDDLSTTRLLLLCGMVLVPLVAWGRTTLVASDEDPMAVAVSLAVSAVFLVVLVIRLARLARLAQRRADALRWRSAELACAVSEQEALQQRLRHQATHDPLTGLANRQMLTDRLAPDRRPAPGALLMLDLDGFKKVNDCYGHAVGDELLVQAARRLAAAAPPRATLARLGGDEFVMLVEDADRMVATRLAERVVTALREPYRVDGERLRISASVGVVVIAGERARSSAEVLRDADAALYEAKQTGRDRAVIRDP